ncbi:MAG: tyrosine--tRNA ligase [Candidatus ainarchaeum sp.]|nr:tyrosine--tRNA ligase [Candidatus ainarchaeum sp.]
MNTEQKVALVRQVGEEIITEQELFELFDKKKQPVAYDGFEPSGNIHIAQGLLRAINVNKMTKAGCKFKMLAADWHALANNKYGGDLEKIQACGDYLIEVWKATEMDFKNVEFVRSSGIVKKEDYWKKVMRIATKITVNRAVRSSQIMGRKESETQNASQIFYPCMQAADIFQLSVDITELGMDQRKVNVLAREIGPELGFWKPVVVSHHMLIGLSQIKSDAQGIERAIELKMSKSIPDSAIFMTDSGEEVERKIMKAYCPEKQLQENPIIEYCKFIVFEKNKKMKIERPAKFGGDIEINSFEELERLFSGGELHPMDLKKSLAFYINEMLFPVRKHFEKGKAKELLEKVQGFKVTR